MDLFGLACEQESPTQKTQAVENDAARVSVVVFHPQDTRWSEQTKPNSDRTLVSRDWAPSRFSAKPSRRGPGGKQGQSADRRGSHPAQAKIGRSGRCGGGLWPGRHADGGALCVLRDHPRDCRLRSTGLVLSGNATRLWTGQALAARRAGCGNHV